VSRARVFGTVTLLATFVTLVPAMPAGAADVRLKQVATIDTGTAIAARSGDSTLYVAEQGGRVVAVRNGKVARKPVLDVSGSITSGGEQGLLGLAFSPDGERLYVHFSAPNGDTRVVEYGFVDGAGGGGRADPSTKRVVLAVKQPQANHNGGQLAFGPDGMLYLGLGDGGGGGDEGDGHARRGNGQALRTLLGKILRIDPQPDLSTGKPYTIPPDNPFANGGGRPEIWSYGLRNPWRFSFDDASDTIWIADVGQDAWEEIDAAPSGEGGVNYGWNVFEGRERFRNGRAAGAVPPVVVLSHDDGYCSVIGGYVYRGDELPDLDGWYLYSDYCNGSIRALRVDGDGDGDGVQRRSLDLSLDQISSFGQDNEGELYVLSQSDGLFKLV
jgi:glucose/arabinose dehydrogenase